MAGRSVGVMEATRILRPALGVLSEVAGLLDVVDPDRGAMTDAERLALVASARGVAGRLQALACVVAGEAVHVGAADHEVGVPLASWLAATHAVTRREAHRLVGQGRDLVRFPRVAEAVLAGGVGVEQAHAITGVLKVLPDDFSPVQVATAENTMLGYAAAFDSDGLRRLSRRLVEVLDPVGSEEREARRLEQDLKAAKAARHLTFGSDGHGSVVIRGSLPRVDAEAFIQVVDAYAQAERHAGLDRGDPLAEVVTPAMRRADGLCALVAAHQRDAVAPSCGGDRPRVVVTLDHDRLLQGCLRAGLLASGEPLTAGELRRLACDAEVLPVVLGGGSEPLDVGRSQRLVTPALRVALTLRDRGCVFPGCDAPATACHAHHLVPWWAGGPTALTNLVLVCPHHHNLVEPARDGPPGERWEVVLAADGIPEVWPPYRVDPERRPLRHQRFRLPETLE